MSQTKSIGTTSGRCTPTFGQAFSCLSSNTRFNSPRAKLVGSEDVWLRLKDWGPGRVARKNLRRIRRQLWFFDEIRSLKKNIVRLPVHRSLDVMNHGDVQRIMELNQA